MIENIDDHRRKFNDRVMELQGKKGKNSRMLTKEHYVKTVERLKILENPLVPRTLPDHNLLRRFGLLRVESGNNMVEKLVKPGTNLRFVPFEDLFDIIHDSHIEKVQAGKDRKLRHDTLTRPGCTSSEPPSWPVCTVGSLLQKPV